MSSFPCLVRLVSGSGQVRYRLGERLVDRYLEFVAGRCRPNTLRAVAFDLKAFFMVTGKDPVEVTAADVFDFLAAQRGDRSVVRLADRESGLSARTIARRLWSVSGLYAYLVARGDTPVRVNPVPRGLMTRRQGGTMRSRMAPLARVPRRRGVAVDHGRTGDRYLAGKPSSAGSHRSLPFRSLSCETGGRSQRNWLIPIARSASRSYLGKAGSAVARPTITGSATVRSCPRQ